MLSLSRDALPSDDKNPRGDPLYAAQISLNRTSMDVEGREVALAPGMMVTVEVKTGKRRLIDYLLSPVMRYRDNSLRER